MQIEVRVKFLWCRQFVLLESVRCACSADSCEGGVSVVCMVCPTCVSGLCMQQSQNPEEPGSHNVCWCLFQLPWKNTLNSPLEKIPKGPEP